MKAPKQKKEGLMEEGVECNTYRGIEMEKAKLGMEENSGDGAGNGEALDKHWKNQSKLSMLANAIGQHISWPTN